MEIKIKTNIETIIANELLGTNDWYDLSRNGDFTIDEIEMFKNKIKWVMLLSHNRNLNDKYLDKLIKEKTLDINNETIRRVLIKYQITEKWFIEKYIKYFDIFEIANTNMYTPKELIKIFGKPSVGTGCTKIVGSDSYPFTVIESKPNTTIIKVQADTCTPMEDFDYYSNQKYKYERDPDGSIYTLRLCKDGTWKCSGTKFMIGARRKYSDPHF